MNNANPSIADHVLIGNCRTAALVSKFGYINWCCIPEFHSPSIFAALLDNEKGGYFMVQPTCSTHIPPEVAAEAVLWAAQHYRREHIIGFPEWKGIYGNMLFPGLGDRYLAKTGYKNQQTSEKLPADQPDNLYKSIDGDFGAHGRFDRMAIEKDHFFEINRNVPFYIIILVSFVIILVLVLLIVTNGL